jgi:hypothetical protein
VPSPAEGRGPGRRCGTRPDRYPLWLAGDADPQDPPSNLAAVPAQQPGAMVAVMPANEHVVGHLGCGPSVIAAFVDAGTTVGLDTSCLAAGSAPAPSFQLP